MQIPEVYEDLYVKVVVNGKVYRREYKNGTIYNTYLLEVEKGFKPSPWWRFWDKNYVKVYGVNPEDFLMSEEVKFYSDDKREFLW